MQSLLAAVGLRRPGWANSLQSEEGTVLSSSDGLLPDFVAVAAGTEQGIIKLEEEARSLESVALQDALLLLRRWSQALRRRPRADEPLASFKAQFLRSNVLERSLEAFRRNACLRNALLGVVLADSATLPGGSATDKSMSEELTAEVCNILQVCLPRAAAPLVQPLLSAAIGDVPMEFVAAALAAVRKLKEEWTEVVRNQATRGLERRLDSLDYELQKLSVGQFSQDGQKTSSSLMPSGSAWQVSHDHVVVLATLCEALTASHSQAENRASEVCATLHVLSGSSKGSGSSSACHECPSKADCEAAIAAMVRRNVPGMQQGLRLLGLPHEPLNFVPGSELKLCGCDIRDAVNDMMANWVEEDMDAFYKVLQQIRLLVLSSGDTTISARVDDGSTTLQAEDAPQVQSHIDTTVSIDAMEACSFVPVDRPHPISIHNAGGTLHTEKQSVLPTARESSADDEAKPTLLARRATVIAKRQELLDQVRMLDEELSSIDEELKHSQASDICAHSSSTGMVDTISVALESTLDFKPPARKAAAALSPTEPQWLASCAKTLVQEFQCRVADISEATAGELQRVAERLKAQQQQRRSQLLPGFASYVECEVSHISALKLSATSGDRSGSVPASGNQAAMGAAAEAVQASCQRVRALCKRVESVVSADGCARGHVMRLLPETLATGSRCRAKWMDGSNYDAEVQCLLGDGTVLVNWLRPQAKDLGSAQTSNLDADAGNTFVPEKQALVTVSESGGDDTCHRIVRREDVHVLHTGCMRCPPAHVQAAQSFLRARPESDLVCIDCGSDGTTWASISFGIYLCNTCAEEHCRLGPRVSFVRKLDDGWGWPQHDLEPMRIGGNATFRADDNYPAVQNLPMAQRYTSRFAEHYRKQLDARCSGCTPPPPLTPQVAASTSAGEYLTMCEAIAVVQHSIQKFDAEVHSAREVLPTVARSNTDHHRLSTGKISSSSDAVGGLLVVQGCGIETNGSNSPCIVRTSAERRFISTQ